MANLNIALTEPLKDWVEAQARTGKFETAGDYVRALIESDREHAASIKALQRAITEGIESCPAQEFDVKEFPTEMNARHAKGA